MPHIGSDDETALVALLRDWEVRARRLLADVEPREHPEGVLSTRDLIRRAEALRRHLGAQPVETLRERKVGFERLFIELRWADERSRAFDTTLVSLVTEVEEYLRCEELMLPDVASKVPAAEREAIARRMSIGRGWYPVQPHPDVPARPRLATAVKPIAAVFDRLRDTLTTAPG
jgi:hypothetical protein